MNPFSGSNSEQMSTTTTAPESTTSPPPTVQVRELGLQFRETGNTAFQSVNLDLRAGEIVAIIGPSGCGKSTLLKSIAGLLRPTEGNIQWAGDHVPELAFIFQDPTLLPWRTALGNVEVPLSLRGSSVAERRERCEQAMRDVLLDGFSDYFPKALSGGMKMRVSLARALTLNPQLLFLDEPFAALDAMTRNQMNELVLSLQRKSGWSVLMVTHSVHEAIFMADRVCIMSPSPGTLGEIIPIQLPRERKLELQTTPAYLDYVNSIRNQITFSGGNENCGIVSNGA